MVLFKFVLDIENYNLSSLITVCIMAITVFTRFKVKEIFLLNEKIYTKLVYNIFRTHETCKYKLKFNKRKLNQKPTSLN